MSPALANEILGFAFETDKPTYRATLNAVAEARKLRPVFLERQSRVQRHALMLSTLTRPTLELYTGNLIRTWLLKKHTAMLADFLDGLGVPHKEGVVDDLPASMDDARLKSAIEALLAKYPPEAVSVYLHAFKDMNQVEWPNLKTFLDADPRLQLGG
jgi:hypothetical protein